MLFYALGLAPFAVWAPPGVADDADAHVAFRSHFRAEHTRTRLQIVGASEYLVWLDGRLVHDGPARFAKGSPESQAVDLATLPGDHVLALQVHNEGVTTRILSEMKPFLWATLDGESVNWKCARIPGYRPRTRRISDILGWIDWCDTRQAWPDWQDSRFDDRRWADAVPAEVPGKVTPATTRPVKLIERQLKPIAQGTWASSYGYETDDPSVRFFLDDLAPQNVPAQGVWRRYDLGRVRLGRPDFAIDAPAGSVIEFAMSEQLRNGRVAPWITLSGSQSSNMDHFVARGGLQDFMPFTPKGGRYLEVHVRATGPVRFVREGFLERTYFGEPIGSFTCTDPLLNQIWKVGVETMRACSEDSFVDCPTRERGEWTGDVASVATDIAAVAYSDLSLSRRALVQAAQAARSDGLVAGVGPGDPGYLSTYAAQWVTACLHYWELSGDKTLLTELHDAARKNISAILNKTDAGGVADDLGWAFVDWGYVRNSGPTDMALNLHVIRALRDMQRWEIALGQPEEANKLALHTDRLDKVVTTWLRQQLITPGGWEKVGYHRASLALLAGLVPSSEKKACVAYIKRHLLTCFPNDPGGPRLSDPSAFGDRFMTPYFAHFAFAALLNEGEAAFALQQYRTCWGWALKGGDKTWLEVFDPRWSHCHEWSGCPTWQLSRYVLGLRPRFDLAPNTYEFFAQTGGLKSASGVVPTPFGKSIHVSWVSRGGRILAEIQSPDLIHVLVKGQIREVRGDRKVELSG